MRPVDFPLEIILNEDQIRERVIELGVKITRDYSNSDLVAIGTLKGSLIFFADLIRHINIPIATDFISMSSYNGNMKSSGKVKIINDISIPVKDKDLLLVEDIIDTGATSKFIFDHLISKYPISLKICSLLNKKSTRAPGYEINIDYSGFDVPDKFLIGYGLDYNEKYRNLPYVAAVEQNNLYSNNKDLRQT